MRLLLILSIVALVIIAGCTGGPAETEPSPVKVPSVEPTPQDLEEELNTSDLDALEGDLNLLDI